MQILINTLDSDPHEPGSLVLDVRNDQWQMEVRFDGATYHIYLFALSPEGRPAWTRLAADGGATAAGARLLARKFWGEIAGSPP